MKPEMYPQRVTEPHKQGTPADPTTFLRVRIGRFVADFMQCNARHPGSPALNHAQGFRTMPLHPNTTPWRDTVFSAISQLAQPGAAVTDTTPLTWPLRKTTHEGGPTLFEPCDAAQANVRRTYLELVPTLPMFEAALGNPPPAKGSQALPSNVRST